MMRIVPTHNVALFSVAFMRTFSACLIFLIVFVIMATLAARWISRPISQLTKATKQVATGNFSVEISQNHSGELGELIHSFNSMTTALSRSVYLKKDFISSISHEFRTPIASIRGFARLLQLPDLSDEQQQEYVDHIAHESDRLSRLADTLLRLTALEQQAAPASISSFQLDEQIRQVILHLEPAWAAKEIDWELSLNPVTIDSDSELLTQVWINLLHNAVKFSHPGGTIEVRVYAAEQAVVEIVDHGIGMTEESVCRIFDQFFQADRSRANEGVGLGLCLVKRILDMLHANIHVHSAFGEGSVFRVHLPFR